MVAPSPSPESVVREFLAAIDRGDIPAAMARVAEEFTFRDRAGTFAVGREDLVPMLEWDVAVGGDPSVRELEVSGDTVRAVIVETNELTRLLELGAFVVDATFVVGDGRIVEEIVEERTEGGPSYTERFRRALQPVLGWAAERHPDRLDAILTDGGLRYDGPTARELVRLVRAWRDAA